ncbi:MAG: stage II sporulation protein P [Clostridia bacterium]|jgi:stage II sporulation protein P|nr:stage II sporulation protein P [Clostridia bacterium]
MKKNLYNRFVFILGIVFLFVGGFLFYYEKNPQVYNTFAQSGIELSFLDNLGSWEKELDCGSYITLVDEAGKELDQLSRFVYVGDEIILEDNKHYKIVKVDDKQNKAIAELVGKADIVWREEWDQLPVTLLAQNKGKVGIYMTHTAESYVPTDGTDSIPGNGGILQVGNTLANTIKKQGVESLISFNKHDPHDANAYHRSRKTAVQLLKNNPLALIDVHRDGVPDPGFYKTEINGQPGTKIRLVVGRQNPRHASNLDFAKNIKAYFDKKSPGLIKGIFLGKGNYNQDLGPNSILIEVGTHTNSRTAAERGVAQFAEGIPQIIGAAAGPGGPTPPGGPRGIGTGTGSAILWLLLFTILGGGAFLLLSTGSWKGSLAKLSELGKEFSNYLGPKEVKTPAEENTQTGDPDHHQAQCDVEKQDKEQ